MSATTLDLGAERLDRRAEAAEVAFEVCMLARTRV
jgi:hypothetical protein